MPSSNWQLFTSAYDYVSIKEYLESDFGMTNNRYDRDQWEDFYGTDNSKESKTTQPIESSSGTKYDPTHYQRGRIQVWDFIVDQQLDFLAGNVIKYICRAGHKDQESELDDWLKVKAYVDRKIQVLTTNGNT
jgi:hypothetical protein